MITLQLLEANDSVDPDDWCRPLSITSMSGGHSDYYSFQNQYTGAPENNVKWVKVKYILGKPWHGLTVKEIDAALGKFIKYEYVRGDIPMRSRLGLAGYSVTNHATAKEPKEYDDAKGRACRYEVVGELGVDPEEAFTAPVQENANTVDNSVWPNPQN